MRSAKKKKKKTVRKPNQSRLARLSANRAPVQEFDPVDRTKVTTTTRVHQTMVRSRQPQMKNTLRSVRTTLRVRILVEYYRVAFRLVSGHFVIF